MRKHQRKKKVSRKIPVRAHKRRVTRKMRVRRNVSRKGSRKARMRGGEKEMTDYEKAYASATPEQRKDLEMYYKG